MLKAADAARLVNPSKRTLKKMRKPLGEKLEVLGWY
jgi:phosphatidylglycerophosphatase C